MRLQQLGASRVCVLQNEIDVFEPVHCSVLNFMPILPCIFIAQLELNLRVGLVLFRSSITINLELF